MLNIESAISNITNCLPSTCNLKVSFSRKHYLAWSSSGYFRFCLLKTKFFQFLKKGREGLPRACHIRYKTSDIKDATYRTQNSANDLLSLLTAKYFVTFLLHDHITQIKLLHTQPPPPPPPPHTHLPLIISKSTRYYKNNSEITEIIDIR